MKGIDIFEAMDLMEDKYLDEAFGERHHKHVLLRWGVRIMAAAAAIIIAFVGIVNLFPATAYAVSDMMILGDLAKAVTFDKSMRACLANEYAQYVGEKKTTADGRQSEVCYMVVDASRVTIFFQTDASQDSADNSGEKACSISPELISGGDDYFYSSEWGETDVDKLYEYSINFVDSKVPEKLEFAIKYYDTAAEDMEDAEPVSKVVYTLYPDRKYTRLVKRYEINRTVEIEGQKITLDKLEVYPTQAKLCLSADEANTAMLEDVSVSLWDDRNREYKVKERGTTGTFNEDGNLAEKWYESSYFSQTKWIRAVVNGVQLIPEEKRYGTISLKNKSIENMPQGVSLKEMKLQEDGSLVIELLVPTEKENSMFSVGQVINMKEIDTEDIKGSVPSETFMHSYSVEDDHADGGERSDETEDTAAVEQWGTLHTTQGEDGRYFVSGFNIPGYKDGAYVMEWLYAPMSELDSPVTVEIAKN